MITAQHINDSLSELKQVELQELSVRVEALLKPPKLIDPDEELVCDVLGQVLKGVGVWAPTIPEMKRKGFYKDFKGGSTKLLEYCREYFEFDKLKKMDRLKLLKILVRLVLESLSKVGRKRDIPISPQIMSQHLGRIGIIVEDQFPGYLASGLLMAVLKGEEAWRV